jgi:hypothetical protein
MCPAHGAEIVPEQKGLEPVCGIFEITERIFTGAGEGADGCRFDLGDIDGGEITGAGQSGKLPGISAVRLDPITRFFRNQRGSHPPTVVPFFHPIPIEPGTTGAGFIDADQMFGLGWHLTDELINVTLASAKTSELRHVGAVIWGHRGDCHGILVDLHADKECVRLRHR